MLRIFVYSLLLANILLIAMRMLQPDTEEAAAPPRVVSSASNLPSIELAENLPEESATVTSVDNAEPDSEIEPGLPASTGETQLLSGKDNSAPIREQQSMACIQVGPFETEESLADLQVELGQLFDRVQSRETRSIVDKGYWVYLPSYPTRAQAAQVIKEMSAAGAREFYIVPDGSMVNAISLGVYERRERAERRRQQLNDLGLMFDFMIEPQTEIETRYYLEAGPVNALNPTLIELSYNNPDTQQIQVDCSFTGPNPEPGVAFQDLVTESADDGSTAEQN